MYLNAARLVNHKLGVVLMDNVNGLICHWWFMSMHKMTDEILSFDDGVWCCLFMVDSDESLVDGVSL